MLRNKNYFKVFSSVYVYVITYIYNTYTSQALKSFKNISWKMNIQPKEIHQFKTSLELKITSNVSTFSLNSMARKCRPILNCAKKKKQNHLIKQ